MSRARRGALALLLALLGGAWLASAVPPQEPAMRLRPAIPQGSFNLPDLRISRFDVTPGVERFADGHFSIRVAYTVTNSGRGASGACKVIARGAAAGREFALTLTAAGQPGAYGALVPELRPGESRTLTGRVGLPRELAGSRVEIFLVADDPAGDEFAAAHGAVRELDESNNASRRITVSLPFVIDAPRTVAPVPARVAPRSQPESWTLGANRVHLERLTEDGDEPYFLTYGFRAKLGERGSAEVFWQGNVGEIVVDAGRGRDVTLPAWMARVTFDDVRRITWDEYVNGVEKLEFLGLIVVAMEHDASDFDDIRRLAPRAVEPVRREVERLIAEARLPLSDPDRAIDAATHRVAEEIEPTTREIVFKFWEASVRLDQIAEVVDPDDFIGAGVVVVAAIEEDFGLLTRDGPMPAPRLRTFNDWSLNFRGTRADRCDWTLGLFATTPRKVVR